MVQVLPGFAPQVGQDIASIFNSIQHVIDPDFQVKEAIRQKALSDPNYAQQLGNFAYSNPEVYKKLGLGKVGDVIGSISPDLKSVMEEAQKGYVAKMAKNPNEKLATEAGQRAIYGTTEQEVRMNELKEVSAGLNIALARQRGTLNDQQIQEGNRTLEQLDLQAKGINEATANYPQLKGVNLGQLADNFLAGKVDGNVLSQIYSTPQLAKPFQELLEIKRYQMQFRNQLRVAEYSHGLNRRSLAEELTLRSGGIGTPEMWDKYMSDPATKDRMFQLAADPKSAKTPQDQMLLQMYNSISAKQMGANAKAANQAMAATYKILLRNKNSLMTPEEAVAALNITFDQLSEQTGDTYQAQVVSGKTKDTSKWYQRSNSRDTKTIQIIDTKTGKPVEPGDIAVSSSGVPNNFKGSDIPSQPPPDSDVDKVAGFNQGKVDSAIGALQKSGLDKAGQLQQIQNSSKLSSAEKVEIIKRLGL